MSGLYIQNLGNDALTLDVAQFERRLARGVTRLRSDIATTVTDHGFACTAVHHGNFRSCGIFRSDKQILCVVGSCWIEDDDDTFTPPRELLKVIAKQGFSETPSARGCFALAHYDIPSRRLTIENDRFGTVPVYYRLNGNGLLVASEIKFLLQPGADKPNLEALAEMLTIGYLSTDQSLVLEILRLPPNHRLIYQQGHLELTRLSGLRFPRDLPADERTFHDLSEKFNHALIRPLADCNELSASLSGGLDSRIATAAAHRLQANIQGFSTGEPGSLETRVASEWAASVNIPMTIHEIHGSTMPDWYHNAVWVTESRCPPEHMHFLAAMFAGDYPAAPQIHGLAGDAIVGGDFDVPSLVDASPDDIWKACLHHMNGFIYWPHVTKKASLAPILHAETENVSERLADYYRNQFEFQGTYSDFLSFRYLFRVCGFTVPCLVSQVLPWTDIVAPYIDSAFFDYCASIHAQPLLDRHLQIGWGLSYFPELSSAPRVKDGIVIPLSLDTSVTYEQGLRRLRRAIRFKYLLCRISQGRLNLPHRESYPFYGQWYRRWPRVRDYVSSVLLDERTLDRGLWQRNGIERLMKDQAVGRNAWAALATILLCEIFIRQFIDGTDRPGNWLTNSKLNHDS